MKNIGILGSWAVEQALGNGLLKYGYRVMVGTRDTTKLEERIKTTGKNSSIGNFNETATFGEILVLACKGTAAIDLLSLMAAEDLAGKTIIDTTNTIANAPPENGVLNYFTNLNHSIMEEIQNKYPKANFVKAFNSIGSHLMVNPTFKEGKPTMFICGNSQKSKTEVSKIIDLFGIQAEDMGEAEAARAIEPLAMLWCIPGFRENKWTHAFKLPKN